MIFILILVSIILYIVYNKKNKYKLKFPKNSFKCKCNIKENNKKIKKKSKIINNNLNKVQFNKDLSKNRLIFLNFI